MIRVELFSQFGHKLLLAKEWTVDTFAEAAKEMKQFVHDNYPDFFEAFLFGHAHPELKLVKFMYEGMATKCPNCGGTNIVKKLRGSEENYCKDCGWTWTPDVLDESISVGYHVLPRSALSDVKKNGLTPGYHGQLTEKSRIFLFTDRNEALWYKGVQIQDARQDGVHLDLVIVPVDIQGLKIKPDPTLTSSDEETSAVYVEGDISKDRIKFRHVFEAVDQILFGVTKAPDGPCRSVWVDGKSASTYGEKGGLSHIDLFGRDGTEFEYSWRYDPSRNKLFWWSPLNTIPEGVQVATENHLARRYKILNASFCDVDYELQLSFRRMREGDPRWDKITRPPYLVLGYINAHNAVYSKKVPATDAAIYGTEGGVKHRQLFGGDAMLRTSLTWRYNPLVNSCFWYIDDVPEDKRMAVEDHLAHRYSASNVKHNDPSLELRALGFPLADSIFQQIEQHRLDESIQELISDMKSVQHGDRTSEFYDILFDLHLEGGAFKHVLASLDALPRAAEGLGREYKKLYDQNVNLLRTTLLLMDIGKIKTATQSTRHPGINVFPGHTSGDLVNQIIAEYELGTPPQLVLDLIEHHHDIGERVPMLRKQYGPDFVKLLLIVKICDQMATGVQSFPSAFAREQDFVSAINTVHLRKGFEDIPFVDTWSCDEIKFRGRGFQLDYDAEYQLTVQAKDLGEGSDTVVLTVEVPHFPGNFRETMNRYLELHPEYRRDVASWVLKELDVFFSEDANYERVEDLDIRVNWNSSFKVIENANPSVFEIAAKVTWLWCV